jgi:hypothetical protein
MNFKRIEAADISASSRSFILRPPANFRDELIMRAVNENNISFIGYEALEKSVYEAKSGSTILLQYVEKAVCAESAEGFYILENLPQTSALCVQCVKTEPVDIRFSSKEPVGFFDNFYKASLFAEFEGFFSIQVTEPMKFFDNHYLLGFDETIRVLHDEFLIALETAVKQLASDLTETEQMTSDGISSYTNAILEDDWGKNRGLKPLNITVTKIKYDRYSANIVQMHGRQHTAFSRLNFSVTPPFVPISVQPVPHLPTPAPLSPMPLPIVPTALPVNQVQPALGAIQPATFVVMADKKTWECSCGSENNEDYNFCADCGAKKPKPEWECECGSVNKSKFCPKCGAIRHG